MNDLIYTGLGLPSKEFGGLCISLDLTITSTLKWHAQKKWALECIEKGFKIVWDLHLGCLDECDETLFLSLDLALQHFIKEILTDFSSSTLGCILYKGKLQFNLDFLKMLQAILPENLTTFLLLETTLPSDLFKLLQVDQFTLAITSQNMPYAFPTMGWGHCHSTIGAFTETPEPLLLPKEMTEAVCLPHKSCDIKWDQLPLCRVISEEALTMSWDGIDRIFVPYSQLSMQGKRKIAGFKAAGGVVVEL